jgi:hypothetical protein
MKNSLKVLWRDVKKSPGLLIALIVVAIGVLYFVYRQNNGGSADTTSTTTDPVYHVQTFSITPPASSSTGTTEETGIGTTPPKSQLVVPPGKSGWLATTPGGTNNKGTNITNLKAGSVLTLLAGPVSFGNNKYYKVQYGDKTGYVNAVTVGLG